MSSTPQLSLHTPVGDLTISAEDGALVAVDWGWSRDQTEMPLLCTARAWLESYFDGEAVQFELPISPAHGSGFQRRVWDVVRTIPLGEARTYGDVARLLGSSPRAVGAAISFNPVPIVIPCHRVVGGERLGGYSGGDGISTKRFLLSLESRSRLPGKPLFNQLLRRAIACPRQRLHRTTSAKFLFANSLISDEIHD